jgi:hypothetical protein
LISRGQLAPWIGIAILLTLFGLLGALGTLGVIGGS